MSHRRNIQGIIGFWPSHLEFADAYGLDLQSVERQLRSLYLESRVPPLFREAVLARLARYARSRMGVRLHSIRLRELGVAPGQIEAILGAPRPGPVEIGELISMFPQRADRWPDPATEAGAALLRLIEVAFGDGPLATDAAGCLRSRLPSEHWAALVGLTHVSRLIDLWGHSDPRAEFLLLSELDALVAESGALSEYVDHACPLHAHGIFEDEASLEREIDARERAEKDLREAHTFVDSIIEHIPLMVFVKDAEELRFVRFNRAGEKLLGFSSDEMLGKNDYDFFPEAEADFFTEKDRAVLDGGELLDVAEEPIHTRHRGTRWLHTQKVPINDPITGEPKFLLGISEDITRQKETAEELERRTAELERSNAELERFSYAASHDLKEPMRMVSSYAELLTESYSDVLDEDGRRYLGYVASGAKRMHGLLSDLLAFSQAGAGGLSLRLTDLRVPISDALANLEPVLRATRGCVIYDPLPEIRCDRTQMTLLFQNLLANALRFRREGVDPRVRIEAARQDAGWRIAVIDNGIGFDPKFSDRIFELWKQLHAREEFGGTGLGLAIARKIVERHGGKIRADGAPGEGATFYIDLPDLPAGDS